MGSSPGWPAQGTQTAVDVGRVVHVEVDVDVDVDEDDDDREVDDDDDEDREVDDDELDDVLLIVEVLLVLVGPVVVLGRPPVGKALLLTDREDDEGVDGVVG